MLLVHVPDTYIPERNYIIKTLLQDFLGFEFRIRWESRSDVLIKNTAAEERGTLSVDDTFFQTTFQKWLTKESLPKRPLPRWDTKNIFPGIPLVTFELPIIYGNKVNSAGSSFGYFVEDKKDLYLGVDIFGSAFFMLTRYEELVKTARDKHDRFSANASLAYQEGFLDRPIINEYLEILWWCMKRLWPSLIRKKRSFRLLLSHDVDKPFAQAFGGMRQLVRNCGGDIIKRKSPLMALERIKSWKDIKIGNYRRDINYTFDYIMDLSERNNLRSTFYFKTSCTNPCYDDNYSIKHPYIRQLLQDIYDRGHVIGLHPSYETYLSLEQIQEEFYRLLLVCEEEGIKQERWGGRQHYLRWKVPITWRNWAQAGLDYDSSLAYAEHAGFRCGICYEYPVYDLEQRKILSLFERPLVVMEGSVMGKQYMNLSGENALNYILMLKDRCCLFDGNFTLLWHNSYLIEPEQREIYKTIVSK